MEKKLKAYYAHCLAIYGTAQEKRDVAAIEALGFVCVNPNSPDIAMEFNVYKMAHPSHYMDFFQQFSEECDVIIFRALPDGTIPAGIDKEVSWFIALGKPVLELPSCMFRRTLTLDETRQYLSEVGQR